MAEVSKIDIDGVEWDIRDDVIAPTVEKLNNFYESEIGDVIKSDMHDFGNNPVTWGSGYEFSFEKTVPIGIYKVYALIPNDSDGSATWAIMIHSGDVSTTYEGISNWSRNWDVLIGNHLRGNLEGEGIVIGQNHKGTIIDCGVMKVKSNLSKLKAACSTASNISSPNRVQLQLLRIK